ncbi:MAG: ribosome maturation factor RimM [Treponema sp.]|nr:ribosome maturation factor RimM [Treponema sp.]
MLSRFAVGLLGTPFGLEGYIKVRSFSGETAHIARLRQMVLRRAGTERSLEVEGFAEKGGSLLVKFKGINDPETAKTLKGAEIVTDRENAAPLGPDEYYIGDLRGMAVVSPEGEVLGQVTDVLEGGGGNLVEMRIPSGELKLVPFRKEFFGDISPEQGRAVLLCRWILESADS